MAMFEIHAIDEQIKALPTVDTASGSVASFETDMTDNLVEVKCQIVAQQSGSGTPSPSNPRPITTYDDLNLIHVGNTDKMSILNGIVDGSYDLIDLGDLAWSYGGDGLFTSSTIPNPRARGEDFLITGLYTNSGIKTSSDMPDMTLQLTVVNQIWVKNSNYTDGTTFKNAMSGVCIAFELANAISPTTYKASSFNALLSAYNISGNVTNIPFGQTVANGVLNVTTGKLRVTHGYYKVDISTNLTAFSASENGSFARINDIGAQVIDVNAVNVFASMAQGIKYIDRLADVTICHIFTDEQGYVILRARASDNITNASDLKTLFTDCEVCYKLATPIEIQLDSITLQALLNENNIWCDTGDTEVKYLLTVGKSIS